LAHRRRSGIPDSASLREVNGKERYGCASTLRRNVRNVSGPGAVLKIDMGCDYHKQKGDIAWTQIIKK
jgi:methionine aminopeptidase